MKTQELIELAVLDAMGLLDEEEREAFDAAFDRAAPAIQAQVRREQTRLCLCDGLLPDVEPPAGMRSLVVEAVRKEMASPARPRHRHARNAVLALVPARQVSPMWRAASVGFAAAALVLGTTFLSLRAELDALNQNLENDRLISAMQSAVGSPYVVALLTDSRAEVRDFTPVAPGTRGQARLWTHPQWGEGQEALLAMSNLPKVEGTLRIVDYTGGQIGDELHEFEGRAGLQLVRFTSEHIASSLAIVARDAEGEWQPLFVVSASGAAGGIAWAEPIDLGPTREA
ncbi:MAG: hypothetical protein R3B68_03060 [Phycisphaerales bacterium]